MVVNRKYLIYPKKSPGFIRKANGPEKFPFCKPRLVAIPLFIPVRKLKQTWLPPGMKKPTPIGAGFLLDVVPLLQRRTGWASRPSLFHKKTPAYTEVFGSTSWSHLGSNQGPPDYESGALTN